MDAHASLIGEKWEFREIRFRVSRYALIDTSAFGGWLKQRRLEKGRKQKELAERLDVFECTVYNWKKGRCGISEENIEKINGILS